MTAYDDDPRVAYDGAGYQIEATLGNRTLTGRVEPFIVGWISFWTTGDPQVKQHDTADEGIYQFIGDPQ